MKTKLTSKHFHATACVITSLICVYHIIAATLEINATHVINAIFSGMFAHIFYLRWQLANLREGLKEIDNYLDEALAKQEKEKANG